MRRDRRMMRDYRRSRMDGRNPYGSKGGYVVSSRGRRDRNYSRDYYTGDLQDPLYHERKRMVEESMGKYPIHTDYEYATDYDKSYGNPNYRGREYDARYDYAGSRNVSYEGRYGSTPFEYSRREDYGEMEDKLDHEELEEWCHKLKSRLEPKDKDMFSKEKVIKKAHDMGVSFDEFTEEELYLTTLMMYTDYHRTLGAANLDIYMKLAKDWLMDDDVAVRGSEKLALYYDEIVMGD